MYLNIALLILLLMSSFGHQSMAQTLDAELDELFSAKLKAGEPGGSILVKKGDEIIFMKSYGIADLESSTPITEHTIFNTGSISKTFVSNSILMLSERGLLSLEDPISKYFPDFENKEIADEVTIKHLLSHSSGLPDIRNVSADPEFYLTAKDAQNWEPIKKAQALKFPVGSDFEYSNPAYNGLALIIEQVSQMPWQQFILDEVMEASGMIESRITNGAHPETGVAHAYRRTNDGTYVEDDYGEVPTFAAAGNGGVWCSVLDLAKYTDAMQEHIFLSEDLLTESRQVYRPKGWSQNHDPFIGYSWFTNPQYLFRSSVDFDVDFIFHTGSQGGFRGYYVTVPDQDILVVALFNRPISGASTMMKEVFTILNNHSWLE